MDTKFAERASTVISNEEDIPDLSSDEIGMMKRRIADVLEPGETVTFYLFLALFKKKNNKERKKKEHNFKYS